VAFADMQQAPKEEEFALKRLPLAYLLEGEFTSLFKNRFIPDEFAQVPFKESGKGKVVVFGDGSVFQSQLSLQGKQPLTLGEDPFAQTTYANKQLLQNLVKYLSDPEGIISTRSKTLQIRPLDKVKVAEQKSFWQLINVGLPVGIILILGGLILLVRKKRFAKKA
jgi:gliding-associated putative ABC transporter substrate-binding component GldG